MTRLGSVQTIIFPVLGQILMGLLIDHFGLMRSDVNPLTLLRVAGAPRRVGRGRDGGGRENEREGAAGAVPRP